MKAILSLLAGCYFYTIQGQEAISGPKIAFDWSVDAGNYFEGKIDDKYPITMYIDFEAEGVSVHEGSIYARAHIIRGWYYYDKVKTKIPLIGFWEGENKYVLYVPKGGYQSQDLSISVEDADEFEIYKKGKYEEKLTIVETFRFNGSSVRWVHKGQVKPVTGIDITQRKVDEFVGLIDPEAGDGPSVHVDLQRLLEEKAYVGIDELQGLNGWAETEVSWSYTHTTKGTNVLLYIQQVGSCNTDRSLIVGIELNKYYDVVRDVYYKVSDCRNFYSELVGDGNNFYSALQDGKYRVMQYCEGIDTAIDYSCDIGSYKIVDNKVIVIKPWSNDFRAK